MKIRSGFVSNSSSSSFVMLGAFVDRLEFSKEDMIRLMDHFEVSYSEEYPEDDFWDAIYNEEFGFRYYPEPGAVGKVIATSSDYYLDEEELSFEEMTDMAEELKETLQTTLGLDVEVKLITGTRPC